MKRNEMTDGQVVAIKRERTDWPTRIDKGIVREPEKTGGTRLTGGKSSVRVERTRFDGSVYFEWVQLWQVMGDYETAQAELDLRKANREIARLKREIRDREIQDGIKPLLPYYKARGIDSYKIRKEFRSDSISVEMTFEQFQNIAYTLNRESILEARLEEARAEIEALKNPIESVAE